MISDDAVEAYNTRLNFDITNIAQLTPSQRDQVKSYGSQAEALIKNRELAMFIHHYKFLLTDVLGEMGAHSADANAERVAIANSLSGINGFVNTLKRAVYYKNKVIAWEQKPATTEKTELKQVYNPNR